MACSLGMTACCMEFRSPFPRMFFCTPLSPDSLAPVEVCGRSVRHQVPAHRQHNAHQIRLGSHSAQGCLFGLAQKWRRTKQPRVGGIYQLHLLLLPLFLWRKRFLLPLANRSLISVQVENQIFVFMRPNRWISVAICFLGKWTKNKAGSQRHRYERKAKPSDMLGLLYPLLLDPFQSHGALQFFLRYFSDFIPALPIVD